MRIVFNAHRVGFGNNGGSRTLIKSAEVLARLGHEVILFGKNKYSWHKPCNVKFVDGMCPKCDVVIATGFHSVANTLEADATRKFYYIRGLELWSANAPQLIKSFKSLQCLVNSEWLWRFLKKHGVRSNIIYQGLDFDRFNDLSRVRNGFASLFHKKHKTKRYIDAIKVAGIVGCEFEMLNRDLKNANDAQLNNWYNSFKVWFAPTELEGLHNPPMEAAASGCALVCSDHPCNGMTDYAIHGETALVYPARNLLEAAKHVKQLLNNEDLRKQQNINLVNLLNRKIGDRLTNMEKLLDIIK